MATTVDVLYPRFVDAVPHDSTAWTQGLDLHDGVLYESTGGIAGTSTLRATDPITGAVLRQAELPPELFGEGIAVIDDHIWQLTWTSGTALLWDRATFQIIGERRYPGQGWGLCHDGSHIIMSNGTDRLVYRDPDTFAEEGSLPVTAFGHSVMGLNDLEWTPEGIWANIFPLDLIARIDPKTGHVTAFADAGQLPHPDTAGVLNGITAVPDSSTIYLSRKLAPTTYRVNFSVDPLGSQRPVDGTDILQQLELARKESQLQQE